MKIIIALALIAPVFVIIVARRPGGFRIARSITISAPPSAAFDQVNDLHRWQEISPYAKMDPAAKYTFDGPRDGTGASLSWVGNNKVGAGKMTILESRPNESVKMKLAFLKPFEVTNAAEFTFEPAGNQTRVTWSLSGQSRFMCKAIGMFVNMDNMIGSQFEEGLANIKRVAETAPAANRLNGSSVAFAQSH